jgi:hypothetical protein
MFGWAEVAEEVFKRVFKSKWFHWTLQAVAIVLCALWWFHVPAPGKAVLALTIAAVVMTIDGLTGWQRASWLVIVFALAFVENHAIDKDRRAFADDERGRRVEENRKFSDIGTSLTTNVQKLIEDSDTKFRTTLAQQSQQFSATMNRFSSVTNEQVTLSRQQQEMVEVEYGHLLPGDAPMPTIESLGAVFGRTP